MFDSDLFGAKIKVMRRMRFVFIILIGILFLGGPVMAAFAQHACDLHVHAEASFERADGTYTHEHVHEHKSEKTEKSSDSKEHCHCHYPCSGTAQNLLTSAPRFAWSESFASSSSWNRVPEKGMIASPDLDGPFQPPRA